MSSNNLELLVPIKERGENFLQPSVILSPAELLEIKGTCSFSSIGGFIVPRQISEEFEKRHVDSSIDLGELSELHQDSLYRADFFDKLVPDFFKGESMYSGLEGKLPYRMIQLPFGRKISKEELSRLYYKSLLSYSLLAQKWSERVSDQIVGFSLDPKVSSSRTDKKVPYFRFQAPEVFTKYRLDDQIIIECGVTYYVRKNI